MNPIQIGSMTVERIVDRDALDVNPHDVYANYDDGNATLARAAHGYLIKTGHLKVLVDPLPGDVFLANLAAAGLTPDQIDIVFNTNLDPQRPNGNTHLVDGEWKPLYLNATYVFTKDDYDFFDKRHSETPIEAFAQKVKPVTAAFLELLVDPYHLFETGKGDNLRMEGAKGHTPGQVVLHIQSADAHAIIAGDVLPDDICVANPKLLLKNDEEPGDALLSRAKLLAGTADKGTIVFPGYAPAPSAGLVTRDGESYRFTWCE